MKRLTHRYMDGTAWVSLNLVSKMGEHECVGLPITKLATYEDAEEKGLLLRLPCKVGDNIYIIKPYGIEEASITGISEADDIDCFCFEIYIDPDCHEIIALEEFNDTWFLTKEEAEAKLKEMECSHE